MGYRTVVFDFDHTLFDTHQAERLAFAQAFTSLGVPDPAPFFADYRRINEAMWRRVEKGELSPAEVSATRFNVLVDELDLDLDASELGDRFVRGMGECGDLYPLALPLLEALDGKVQMAVLTNALAAVQRTRIERLGLERFFDVIIISSEVGSAKPSPTIFAELFRQLENPPRESTVMVGDSLVSDIAGGSGYGMPTLWYNPHGKTPGPDDVITHEVASLADIPSVVL